MRTIVAHFFIVILLIGTVFTTFSALAQDLVVSELAVGQSVNKETRAIVGAGTEFASDISELVCFTKITGSVEETKIYHVWYYQGQKMAKIPLSVKSASWRTWSSKKIMPGWTGEWSVKILNSGGLVLATEKFTINKAATTAKQQEGE